MRGLFSILLWIMNKIALIIPLYNSAPILPRTLSQLRDFFTHRNYLEELIFVDDGSRDKTSELVEMFIRDSGLKVTLLRNERNMGKGLTVKRGVLSVSDAAAYTFFSDDDIPFGLDPLHEMYTRLESDPSLDIVTGDRTLIFQHNPYPYHRQLGSYVYGLLLPRCIRVQFPDTHAGLRAYRTPIAKKIFGLIKNTRWSFDPEIFLIAIVNNFKVGKVLVHFLEHVEGTNFALKDFVAVAREIIKMRFHYLLGHYKMR